MNDEQLLRYSRQLLLPEVDWAGQQRLLKSRVLIIGLGGLGSPVAMYLASAGVGHLVLVDDDRVELSNLQRQIIHPTAHIGQLKGDSAAATLRALNPHIQLTVLNHRLNTLELQQQAELADVIVDACDNFATRFNLNRVALQTRTDWVSGAAIRLEGQVTVFLPNQPNSPCYHCLYAEETAVEEVLCSTAGVLGPVVGMIGCIQALETLKILLGLGTTLCGSVLLLDAKCLEWRRIRLQRDQNCRVCSG